MSEITAEGLDYSYQHPDVACAYRSGYRFVARYVGDPDPNGPKYLDAAELAHARAAGLAVVAVRETSAGFMLTESGADHARRSREHCNRLGMAGVPIYYALDVDPRGLNAAQVGAVGRFLRDAAAADGGGRNVGLYAAYKGIEKWVGTPYCQWGWQTYAWSAGHISPKAHLRQYANGRQLCGGIVDLNEAYRLDFGQWPRPSATRPHDTEEWSDMASEAEIRRLVQDETNDVKAFLTQVVHDETERVLRTLQGRNPPPGVTIEDRIIQECNDVKAFLTTVIQAEQE